MMHVQAGHADSQGNTALHYAAANGHTHIVAFLLSGSVSFLYFFFFFFFSMPPQRDTSTFRRLFFLFSVYTTRT